MTPADPKELRISDFTYDLPDERIPRYPVGQRDQSKLLVFKNGIISETLFRELPSQLPYGAMLIFNESKVIPARLIFKNANHREIEVFCLEPGNGNYQESLSALGSCVWRCLTGGLKKWKTAEQLILKNGDTEISAELIQKETSTQLIRFSWTPPNLSFSEVIENVGELPIPPYLTRSSEEIDKTRYQTVYSKVSGSVAAPTAGLHFTPQVLQHLREQGFETSSLILHVGAGTFKPVKAEFLADHEMHAEWMTVDPSFIKRLLSHQDRPIIAVGTTSLRAIESLYWMGVKVNANPGLSVSDLGVGQWDPYEMPATLNVQQSLASLLSWLEKRAADQIQVQTKILIAPPYQLKIANAIITNFHQPNSTLLVLISAIAGEKWKEIYQYALSHDFRFLSYGDSSLIVPPSR